MGRTRSPFTNWLRERTAFDADAIETQADLYADYSRWFAWNYPLARGLSRQAFSEALRVRDIAAAGKDPDGKRLRRGLRLTGHSLIGPRPEPRLPLPIGLLVAVLAAVALIVAIAPAVIRFAAGLAQ